MVGVLKLAGFERALVVAVEEVLGELGELAGAEERLGVDHVGREDFGVAVLAGVQVEHEVGQRAFEAGSLAEVDDEARAGDLGGALEVEDAEALADLPVRAGRGRSKCRRRVARGLLAAVPDLLDAVVVLGFADGNGVLGKVGDAS